jgi:hypothetical protein
MCRDRRGGTRSNGAVGRHGLSRPFFGFRMTFHQRPGACAGGANCVRRRPSHDLQRKREAIVMNQAFLKAAAAPGALPFSRLPGVVAAVAAQAGASREHERLGGNAHRSRTPQNASGSGTPSVHQSSPSAPSLKAVPGDLIARTLAILAEEDKTWQARRIPHLAPRNSR